MEHLLNDIEQKKVSDFMEEYQYPTGLKNAIEGHIKYVSRKTLMGYHETGEILAKLGMISDEDNPYLYIHNYLNHMCLYRNRVEVGGGIYPITGDYYLAKETPFSKGRLLIYDPECRVKSFDHPQVITKKEFFTKDTIIDSDDVLYSMSTGSDELTNLLKEYSLEHGNYLIMIPTNAERNLSRSDYKRIFDSLNEERDRDDLVLMHPIFRERHILAKFKTEEERLAS